VKRQLTPIRRDEADVNHKTEEKRFDDALKVRLLPARRELLHQVCSRESWKQNQEDLESDQACRHLNRTRTRTYCWGSFSGACGGGMRTGSGSFTPTGVLERRFFDPSVVR
jgi:hypothetical protein